MAKTELGIKPPKSLAEMSTDPDRSHGEQQVVDCVSPA